MALDATENAYVQVGVHEMVHYVREMDQDAYAALEEVVSRYLGSDMDELVEQRKAEYAGVQELTDEAAREEIIAEVVPQVLTNEESARVLVEKNETLVQKIWDHFVKFARNLCDIAQRYVNRTKHAEIALIESNTEALMEIADTLDMALELAKGAEGRKEHTEKNSIRTDADGARYVSVDVDQEQFEGLTGSALTQRAQEVIREKFVGRIIGEDDKAYVGGITAREYTHPAKKIKNYDAYNAKMKASAELDHLFEVSTFIGHNDDDGRHEKATGGWDHYKTVFEVEGHFYEGDVSVMLRDNGRLLYDITKIKEYQPGDYSLSGRTGTAVFPAGISNTSISDFAEDVNEKYSVKADGDTAQLIEETKAEEKAEMLDDAGRIARKVVSEYKSTVKRSEAASRIDEMIDAYQDHDDAKAAEIADQLAKEIVDNSVKLDTSHREGYEEIRRRLRETGLSLTDTQKQEVTSRYGRYVDWHRSGHKKRRRITEMQRRAIK